MILLCWAPPSGKSSSSPHTLAPASAGLFLWPGVVQPILPCAVESVGELTGAEVRQARQPMLGPLAPPRRGAFFVRSPPRFAKPTMRLKVLFSGPAADAQSLRFDGSCQAWVSGRQAPLGTRDRPSPAALRAFCVTGVLRWCRFHFLPAAREVPVFVGSGRPFPGFFLGRVST